MPISPKRPIDIAGLRVVIPQIPKQLRVLALGLLLALQNRDEPLLVFAEPANSLVGKLVHYLVVQACSDLASFAYGDNRSMGETVVNRILAARDEVEHRNGVGAPYAVYTFQRLGEFALAPICVAAELLNDGENILDVYTRALDGANDSLYYLPSRFPNEQFGNVGFAGDPSFRIFSIEFSSTSPLQFAYQYTRA